MTFYAKAQASAEKSTLKRWWDASTRVMQRRRNPSCSAGKFVLLVIFCFTHTRFGSYLDRFVDQELKYEETRRVQSSNLDYMIQSHNYGRANDVAIDSSGKIIEYPEKLHAAAALDEAVRGRTHAASRVPVHARVPSATLVLPRKETSLRRIDFKRSA
jgi:hypothetical protein